VNFFCTVMLPPVNGGTVAPLNAPRTQLATLPVNGPEIATLVTRPLCANVTSARPVPLFVVLKQIE